MPFNAFDVWSVGSNGEQLSAVLNGVSNMVYGPSGTDLTTALRSMGGVSLILGVLGAVLTASFRPDQIGRLTKYVVGVMIVSVGVYLTPVTVNVHDSLVESVGYAGSGPTWYTPVQRVPVGVALPLMVVTNLEKELTEMVDGGFTNAIVPWNAGDGTRFLTLSRGGLSLAGNALLALHDVSQGDPRNVVNSVAFVDDCLVPAVSLKVITTSDLAASADLVSTIEDHGLLINFFTTYEEPPGSSPAYTAMNCPNMWLRLRQDWASRYAYMSTDYANSGFLTYVDPTAGDTVLTGIAQSLLGYPAGTTATDLRLNAWFFRMVDQGIGEAMGYDSGAMQVLSEKVREFKANQRAYGIMAYTWMPKMKSILLAVVCGLWVVLVPLVFLNEFKVLKGWMLLLVWLSLWGPLLAIINGIYTDQLSNVLGNLSASGFTFGNRWKVWTEATNCMAGIGMACAWVLPLSGIAIGWLGFRSPGSMAVERGLQGAVQGAGAIATAKGAAALGIADAEAALLARSDRGLGAGLRATGQAETWDPGYGALANTRNMHFGPGGVGFGAAEWETYGWGKGDAGLYGTGEQVGTVAGKRGMGATDPERLGQGKGAVETFQVDSKVGAMPGTDVDEKALEAQATSAGNRLKEGGMVDGIVGETPGERQRAWDVFTRFTAPYAASISSALSAVLKESHSRAESLTQQQSSAFSRAYDAALREGHSFGDEVAFNAMAGEDARIGVSKTASEQMQAVNSLAFALKERGVESQDIAYKAAKQLMLRGHLEAKTPNLFGLTPIKAGAMAELAGKIGLDQNSKEAHTLEKAFDELGKTGFSRNVSLQDMEEAGFTTSEKLGNIRRSLESFSQHESLKQGVSENLNRGVRLSDESRQAREFVQNLSALAKEDVFAPFMGYLAAKHIGETGLTAGNAAYIGSKLQDLIDSGNVNLQDEMDGFARQWHPEISDLRMASDSGLAEDVVRTEVSGSVNPDFDKLRQAVSTHGSEIESVTRKLDAAYRQVAQNEGVAGLYDTILNGIRTTDMEEAYRKIEALAERNSGLVTAEKMGKASDLATRNSFGGITDIYGLKQAGGVTDWRGVFENTKKDVGKIVDAMRDFQELGGPTSGEMQTHREGLASQGGLLEGAVNDHFKFLRAQGVQTTQIHNDFRKILHDFDNLGLKDKTAAAVIDATAGRSVDLRDIAGGLEANQSEL
jgi:hypothetical protein